MRLTLSLPPHRGPVNEVNPSSPAFCTKAATPEQAQGRGPAVREATPEAAPEAKPEAKPEAEPEASPEAKPEEWVDGAP